MLISQIVGYSLVNKIEPGNSGWFGEFNFRFDVRNRIFNKLSFLPSSTCSNTSS